MRLSAVIAFAVLAAAQALAQSTGSRMSEPAAPPPSRWTQDKDALDQALRQRVLTATDPRDLWVAGQLDRTDPWAQVAALAQARNRAPGEMIFVASLAAACLAPTKPLPPECDAVDRLADWATRDADNGVPSLLLADRARARNNLPAMIAFLEEAAARPRFDDYRNRGALILWQAVKAVPGSVDPAARVELAASLGAGRESYAVGQMQLLCREGARVADNIRGACFAAGTAAAQHAADWPLRVAGARLAERNAAPAEQDATRRRASDVARRGFECAEAGNEIVQALQSPDAAVRARAVAQWEARLAREAQIGEVAVCEGKPG